MFEFALERTVGAARAGTLTLPHGTVRTPAFMPVGTHGVVRGLSAADVRRTGAQIILGNTYHLHIRPGEDVVRAMGGLHRFTTWDRPMLTVTGAHVISKAMRLCGGDNVFSGLPGIAPEIDREAVLRADPEAIVASSPDGGWPAWLDDWKAFAALAAVRQGNLYAIRPELLQRHTPRLLDGAAELCRILEDVRRKRVR